MATNVNVLDRAPAPVFSALNWVLPHFEDLTGLDRPRWGDYSIYDGNVNFELCVINGLWGFANRSTLGWSGVDQSFKTNWAKGGDTDLYRTSYHVLYPSLSVPKQMDHWFDHHPEIDYIPRVLDAD